MAEHQCLCKSCKGDRKIICSATRLTACWLPRNAEELDWSYFQRYTVKKKDTLKSDFWRVVSAAERCLKEMTETQRLMTGSPYQERGPVFIDAWVRHIS